MLTDAARVADALKRFCPSGMQLRERPGAEQQLYWCSCWNGSIRDVCVSSIPDRLLEIFQRWPPRALHAPSLELIPATHLLPRPTRVTGLRSHPL